MDRSILCQLTCDQRLVSIRVSAQAQENEQVGDKRTRELHLLNSQVVLQFDRIMRLWEMTVRRTRSWTKKNAHNMMSQPTSSINSAVGLRRKLADPCAKCPTQARCNERSKRSDIMVYSPGESERWPDKRCQQEKKKGDSNPIHLRTFLNSEAQLRIVVEIGGGSVACGANTG